MSVARAETFPSIPGYTILGLLGKGGMGAVYRARQVAMDRIVAVKILPADVSEDRNYLDRFVREARASAKLNHPHIIQGIDVGQVGGTAYFVMEYVDGPTLAELIKKRGKIPWREAAKIMLQLADALEHASKVGMVHRDIKPDNILLTPRGDAKLVDLGLAKVDTNERGLTKSGNIVGTPAYIAPEQAAAAPNIDIRADVYSLGATFFHALTGQLVFKTATAASTMAAHLSQSIPWPRKEHPDIPDSLVYVLTRMLAKATTERYLPHDLVADLQSVLDDGKVKAASFRGKSSIEMPAPRPLRAVHSVEGRRTTRHARPVTRWSLRKRLIVGLTMLVAIIACTYAIISKTDRTTAPTTPKTQAPAAKK
jgi:eukaryotic-like serine/threonine-protein kinase